MGSIPCIAHRSRRSFNCLSSSWSSCIRWATWPNVSVKQAIHIRAVFLVTQRCSDPDLFQRHVQTATTPNKGGRWTWISP